ncbi:Z1 domain-containing protein [Mucilaginibacter sabulilitoris]|uniref:Z1 domain-containing protein n=1 Tax=Mucilaginibacter sabulilitoris TaxID=1173583 RepID=A0ABZ0TH42_9SPHI|nr:Z1 domain-containing protein [Mucilaginibacter sabulilitoris]WPU92492.1 Z1 domain-containing protein [Mucilaginibacter sabulilitoris]
MQTNSYQAVKQFIYNKLNDTPSPLGKSIISQEIENFKNVIASVPKEILISILSVQDYENLSIDDWHRMTREFEIHFDVEMRHGILIQGDEQQKRDTLWWTSIQKQLTDNYYWERLRNYLLRSLPPEVVKTIDTDTDLVMNNLENPTKSDFNRYGMVVGHVQSGKTGNYSSLICKAADAGYKFIVVIAGGINNLRDQTQERLNESFIGQHKGSQVGAGIGNTRRESMPYSLTTVERDFNKQDADRLAHGINFDTVSVPILLVIKKNTSTLKNVIDWLEMQYKGNDIDHAMLVIDDESDYASINTKEKEDPTAINLRLRKLLSLFKKSAYVAYTATPYANIFIDHQASHTDVGNDLFPQDFIYALDAPSNYFGARKIFIDSEEQHLIPIEDNEFSIPYDHKKDFKLEELPGSLLDAIRLFVLNIGIRRLRGQGNKHNSMLIHATRFTDVHKNLATLTEEYLKEKIKKDVVSYSKLFDALDQSETIRDLKTSFDMHLSEIEFSWDQLLAELPAYIETVVVREVHLKKTIPLEYRKDTVTNAIVIGGASLARGFTVEGLSISYFLRNTVFYDTLMQMGRWFGYRPGYEDICKIFMPQDRIRDFAEIIRATEDLISDFKLMAEHKKTPNDFGLYLVENPDSALQITARNKQKNVQEFYYSMQLDGSLKETSYLRAEAESIDHNINAIKDLLVLLPQPSTDEKTIVWKNINKSLVKKFIKEFKTVDKDKLGLTSRMPIAFILKYLDERTTDWDIALYSGNGDDFVFNDIGIKKQYRRIKLNKGAYEVLNRQVSSGTSESITIEDDETRKALKNDRKAARAARVRPLLMLHILQVEDKDDPNYRDELAAFGISFSGDALTKEKPAKLLINTVYFKNLTDSLKLESESDD